MITTEIDDPAERAQTEFPSEIRRVVVVLIKPTSYDDQGFPFRFWRGVLPSNSLAAMQALTDEALGHIVPAGVPVEIHMYEDCVKNHARKLAALQRRFPEDGTRLIVGLVAVQTAQFPRACDLLDAWSALGATCVIGGFHVSGSIATMLDGVDDPQRPDIPSPHKMPAEIQKIIDKGTIVFQGEAEEVWPDALEEILCDQPRSLYRGGLPPLGDAPIPSYPPEYFEGSFATPIGTFDTGRGCPFECSFCTIINVQGRKTRFRTPEAIIKAIEALCIRDGSASFFFTDDNFARNPMWRKILRGLIDLRREGHEIAFMIESDLVCYKMKDFLPMLSEAGCGQIFMGVESMNPESLQDANKWQNKIQDFKILWDQCHELGIAVHAGYIIGFPHDTPESIQADVESLFEVGVDQASFFMLTPLPGSEDHARAVAAGVDMDPDLSKRDSFHVVMDHPRMSRDQWFAAYQKAWRSFYRVRNMIAALKRCDSRKFRRGLMRNFLWYRWSFATERTHPMIAGLYRFRDLADRKPGSAPLAYPRYVAQEIWRHMRYVGRGFAEFYRFQHVVFETEFAPVIAEKRDELTGRLRGVGDWVRRTFGHVMTRQWLNAFWIEYGHKRWHLLLNPWTYRWHVYMLPYAFSEVIYTLRFILKIRRLSRGAAG